MAQREIDPTVQQRMSAADEGLGQKSRAKIAKEERESLLLSAWHLARVEYDGRETWSDAVKGHQE